MYKRMPKTLCDDIVKLLTANALIDYDSYFVIFFIAIRTPMLSLHKVSLNQNCDAITYLY